MEPLAIVVMFTVLAGICAEAGRQAGYRSAMRKIAAKERDAMDDLEIEQMHLEQRRRKEQE